MGHSVGDAAKRSTAKGMAVKPKEVLTPEKAIQEIRNLRAGKLFVTNMEYVDLLLAEYDKLVGDAYQAEAEKIAAGGM